MATALMLLGFLVLIGGMVDAGRPVPVWVTNAGPGAIRKHWLVTGATLVAGVCLIASGVILAPKPSSTLKPTIAPAETGREVEAWTVCQGFVEQELKAPGKYPFRSVREFVTPLGNGAFRIQNYIDTRDARVRFTCEVTSTPRGWFLKTLSFEN